MTKHLDNNTTTINPTHFPRAIDLVKQGMKKYKMCSENWVYPTTYNFGFSKDHYYAEIWHNGMDWNSVYWLIEAANLENPKIYPIVFFADNSQREAFNDYDFENLCNAIMHYRRETLWIKSHDPKGYYGDIVWPFIKKTVPEDRLENCNCMVQCAMLHASQPEVLFYLNENLIPKQESLAVKCEKDKLNKLSTNSWPTSL